MGVPDAAREPIDSGEVVLALPTKVMMGHFEPTGGRHLERLRESSRGMAGHVPAPSRTEQAGDRGYVAALFRDLIDDKSEDGDYTE